MNDPKTGDLVYIIDPDGEEPIKMGYGLVVGETKSYGTDPIYTSTPVMWNGKVEYLGTHEWMLEVISPSHQLRENS